jgi:hypothetical protein
MRLAGRNLGLGRRLHKRIQLRGGANTQKQVADLDVLRKFYTIRGNLGCECRKRLDTYYGE